uniref:Lipoprotein n=1 Tax=uncultured Thiotrichaceae bacterium TaxID=298394 RepID=A0A6S6TZC7_9GAMM|nr:MAG: FIG003461: hypothetical protein [uncultured Thiotrichaceae bacterium]
MKKYYLLLLCAMLILPACGDEQPKDSAAPVAGKDSSEPVEVVVKAETAMDLQAKSPALLRGSDNKIAVGTPITDLVKPGASPKTVDDQSDVKQIMWEDLIPADFKPEKIMEKYQAQIDEMPEGAPGEKEMFAKIMAEFNAAPSNDLLNGKTVRIPGFVSPLDSKDGIVTDFLLVPYFGSCIHSPPPPVNQTVLVDPLAGKSIPMEGIYEPVWVTGRMTVENKQTDLAMAGYFIEDARLEPYSEPEEETVQEDIEAFMAD